jgi:lysophospholipase L1-like esterase
MQTIDNLIVTFTIGFFIYIFLQNNFKSYKENLNQRHKIVLLGDSILENSNYVENYFSVESKIKEKHGNVFNLAQDNATIDDLKIQVNRLQQKKLNKDDVIFISIGGNDILNQYRFRKKNNISYLNDIFERYKSTISKIKNQFTNKIILINIYSPPNVKDYHYLIKLWNSKQKKFSQENNIKVVDINSIFNHKRLFVKNIEPSNDGSRILAKAIVNSL